MVRKAKKEDKKNKLDLNLEHFSIGDEEIAAELSASAKKKVLASYELDRLIEQSDDAFFVNHRKKLIFTHSPHLLNLQDKKLKKKEQEEVVPLEVKSKKPILDSMKPVNLLVKMQRLAAWQRPKFSFEFPNIYRLSVIQIIYSVYRLFILLLVAIKYSFKQSGKAVVKSAQGIGRGVKHSRNAFTDSMILKYSRSLLVFIIVAVMLMLPYFGFGLYSNAKTVQGRVMGVSQEAARTWQMGLDNMMQGNWTEAETNFNEASINFANAQSMLRSYTEALDKVPDWLSLDSTEVGTGLNLVEIGAVMSEVSLKLNTIAALSNKEGMSLSDKLIVLSVNLNEIYDLYSTVAVKVNKINLKVIPEEYRSIFAIWQSQSNELYSYLGEVTDNINWILSLTGTLEPKRYLLVFQNSNELRATGGFMGSFALLDMAKGEIQDLSIPGGGLYDLESQVREMVVAPYPHQLLGARWQIWDANWWSDWPTTARKIAWFYESANGPSVDGVIAINSQLIIDLVGYFEPIVMPEYDKELTSSNVVTALQHAVEFEYDKTENKPKQILADLAPILIDDIYSLPPIELFGVASMLYDHLDRSDIQIYLFDEEMQSTVENKSWSGKVPDITGDYLQVVVHNIGGGKSDEAIKQTVDYDLVVGPDNYLIGKATIKREHQGDINDVFTGHRNVSFIRVLVPKGSELIAVEGAIEPDEKLFKEVPDYLEADKDLIQLDGINYYNKFNKYYSATQFNKQVFGQWLMVDPGEAKEITFIYRLPFKIDKDEQKSKIASWLLPEQYKLNYTFYYDKQSGMDNQTFKFNFVIPKALDSKWFSDSLNSMYKIGKTLSTEAIINEDYQLGFILR
ncbi:MAG: DUF4012 domain-containing protein [Candidatus Komeilibacteria bacterium]